MTITLSEEEEFHKLEVCARYRQKASVDEVVRCYLQDWIDTDYPASQWRVSRRQIYREHN